MLKPDKDQKQQINNANNSSAIDDKDRIDYNRKLQEQKAINILKLQRKQRLQSLIQKRKTNMNYLKKVHQGGSFWLNIAMLSSIDIAKYTANRSAIRQRTESFFSLALSISRILQFGSGSTLLWAFSQLIEEWEYYWTLGATMQSVKFVMAKQSSCIYPQTLPSEGYNDLVKPSIYKFQTKVGTNVVFEHLQVPHLPFPLDYVEVFCALCDEIYKLYEKLMHEECYRSQIVYDTIVRLDARIKHHVINLAAKELNEVALDKMRQGILGVRVLNGMTAKLPQVIPQATSQTMLDQQSTPPTNQVSESGDKKFSDSDMSGTGIAMVSIDDDIQSPLRKVEASYSSSSSETDVSDLKLLGSGGISSPVSSFIQSHSDTGEVSPSQEKIEERVVENESGGIIADTSMKISEK